MAVALADIHVKVDPDIKTQSETVLNRIGISMSDLVNMTLRRVVYERDIPFETRVPEAALPEAMRIKSEAELVDFLNKRIAENEKSDKYYTLEELAAEPVEATA